MSAEPGPDTATPVDPEHDRTATYALDPAHVRRLTARIVSTTGEHATSTAPFTGQPVASLPVSSPDDVAEAVRRARVAQAPWARVPSTCARRSCCGCTTWCSTVRPSCST
ncbi:MAG: hypothetical protein WKF76_08900 [Nocardioidaceae bacterium]